MSRGLFQITDWGLERSTFLADDSIMTFENREIEKLESEKRICCEKIVNAMYEIMLASATEAEAYLFNGTILTEDDIHLLGLNYIDFNTLQQLSQKRNFKKEYICLQGNIKKCSNDALLSVIHERLSVYSFTNKDGSIILYPFKKVYGINYVTSGIFSRQGVVYYTNQEDRDNNMQSFETSSTISVRNGLESCKTAKRKLLIKKY